MTTRSVEEQLVFFPCGSSNLAGVLTLASEPNGRTVLIPWGASTAPSSGVNRVRTRLARKLAAEGFNSFRFDYPGVGESDGDYKRPDMSTPLTAEVLAAHTWLASQGLERIVIVANCFGGWSALMAAPDIKGLDGVMLVNPPVRRDHKEVRAADERWQWWAKNLRRFRLRKLFDPSYRAKYRKMLAAKTSSVAGSGGRDRRFADAVGHLLNRKVPVLIMYGDDDFRADFEAVMKTGLASAIERAGPPTRVVLYPDRLSGFGSLDTQALLMKEVISWLHSLSPVSA
jgi:pimeloyl-ACP methyl ester carboxylesterase